MALVATLAAPTPSIAQGVEYKVVATNKTSTMQKEMTEAAEAGYRFVGVMGGETSFGGNEVVTLMQKTSVGPARFSYKLLATSKTSTMQKELQEAGEAGFDRPRAHLVVAMALSFFTMSFDRALVAPPFVERPPRVLMYAT